MDCANVRAKLSAYLEGEASRQDSELIGEHLRSCGRCSTDLIDLKKAIDHIKGLEDVEPPVWMNRNIMAAVREEAGRRKRIIWKLFHPLHIKLPLEAVAAVLVIGIALYVYRGFGPETRVLKGPAEKPAPETSTTEIPGESMTAPGLKSELKKVPAEAAKRSFGPAQGKVSGKEDEETDRIEAAPGAPGPALQMPPTPERQEAAPAAPARETAPAAAGALKKDARSDALQRAPKLKFSEEKLESPVLTLKVREVEGAGKQVERMVTDLGGTIIERQSHEGRRMFAIYLNADKFDELFEKLKAVGEVKGTEPEIKGREGGIKLRIEVMEKPQRP